jgi:hypothetical protein
VERVQVAKWRNGWIDAAQFKCGVLNLQLSPEPQPRPPRWFALGLAPPSAESAAQMRNQGCMNVELLTQTQHHEKRTHGTDIFRTTVSNASLSRALELSVGVRVNHGRILGIRLIPHCRERVIRYVE